MGPLKYLQNGEPHTNRLSCSVLLMEGYFFIGLQCFMKFFLFKKKNKMAYQGLVIKWHRMIKEQNFGDKSLQTNILFIKLHTSFH